MQCCTVVDGCRILEFTAFIDGHALVNHVIRNLSLEQRDGCRIACYRDEECLSYNFGRIQNRTFICQLSDSDHVQHPADLRKRDNIGYQGTMVNTLDYQDHDSSLCIVL